MTNPAATEPFELVPQSAYVRELKAELPPEAFEPATSRLLLLPAHLAVIVVGALAIARGWVPSFVVPIISLAIGVSFACLAFVAHEAVHGGIVRGRTARQLVGAIGFAPFTLSPRLWAAWHDRIHHANANLTGDPDTYPTLDEYHASGRVRIFVNVFSPGNRRWRGVLTLLFGFTGQSTMQLIVGKRFMKPRAYMFAILETAAAVAVWATVAIVVGFVPFLFIFVLPLLVGNAIVMAFILTNHALSPRVEVNDPLVTGLSVTSPRWFEWITLKFGYHVEHHLFPAMSSRHARRVRDLLRARWPQRYQSMPLRKALAKLHRTARVYKDAVTLVDPRTGAEYPTLQPRSSGA